jgi:hypothetical protein
MMNNRSVSSLRASSRETPHCDGGARPASAKLNPGVTYANGRYFLNERYAGGASNPTLSPEERQTLVDRHFEAAAYRQAYSDANLAAALKLGAKLRALKE